MKTHYIPITLRMAFLLTLSMFKLEASDFSAMTKVKGVVGDFSKTSHPSVTYHYSNERLNPDFNAPLGGKTLSEVSITLFYDKEDDYLWSNALTVLDKNQSKVSSMELKIRSNRRGGQMVEFFLEKEYVANSKILLITKNKSDDEPSGILVIDLGSLNLKLVE